MSGPITRNEHDVYPSAPRTISSSVGRDESQDGIGNPRINIDLGKSVNSIALCAALCGICTAVTIGTVWHSNAREVETQARMRVLQNHVDDMTSKLVVIEKLEERNYDTPRR